MWSSLVILGVLFYLFYRILKFWIFDPWSIHRDLQRQGIPGRYKPIIGEMLVIHERFSVGDPFSYAESMVAQYGSYYRTSFGPFACLNTNDPALIECVLKTNARFYRKPVMFELLIGGILGQNNLLVAEGEKHARHRRLIAPAFQHKNLNSMISLMVKTTQRYMNKWANAAAQSRSGDQTLTMDLHEQMAHLTLDIVTGCVFGTEISEDSRAHDVIYENLIIGLNEAENRIYSMIALIPLVKQLPLLSKRRLDKAKQNIHDVVRHIVEQRKCGSTKSACQGPDLLDLLLMASEGKNETQKLTDDEVFDEALTFVLAGHETTSTLMTWTLYNLATHPDVLKQCVKEVDSIFNEHDELTTTNLSLLTYIEAVLKESLRCHQPVAVLIRTAMEENTLIASDGKKIRVPKGTDLILNIFIVHRSEKYWHEPNVFDPSRFLERQSEKLLSFGVGPRSCIGQNFAMLEAKVMLAMIVRQFHFELVPGQNHAMETAITIKPKYGMWMRFYPRNLSN